MTERRDPLEDDYALTVEDELTPIERSAVEREERIRKIRDGIRERLRGGPK